ncbi:MAG: hypothetical protein ACTSUN_08885 [Promethearchaeota archaeon]
MDVVITTEGDKLVIIAFFEGLINIFRYLIFSLFYVIVYGFAFFLTLIFSIFPLFNSNYMFSFIEEFFYNYFSLWFRFPGGRIPELFKIPELIVDELLAFTQEVYLLVFQILLLYSIISIIRAFFSSDPKFTMRGVGSIVLMIVFPFMIFRFRDMIHLFNLEIEYFENLVNPIRLNLNTIPIDNFFAFLITPTAIFAIACYLNLEWAFQINYIDNVTNPVLERSERLETQLEIIEKESKFITTDVDKIKEEARKKKEELGLEGVRASKIFAKTTQKISYIKEMIEKKRIEQEEKKLISAASKTRRLGRYVERLFREDAEAKDTLTAQSSAPKAKSLVLSTIFIFFYRMILLILISFIIIHPRWFFINVFNLPEAITRSVAMYSPEVILILLLPIILLFPVISKIISYIKHRTLILRLKQEGKIKEILASVGDYVRVQEEPEEELREEREGGEASEPASSGAA